MGGRKKKYNNPETKLGGLSLGHIGLHSAFDSRAHCADTEPARRTGNRSYFPRVCQHHKARPSLGVTSATGNISLKYLISYWQLLVLRKPCLYLTRCARLAVGFGSM